MTAKKTATKKTSRSTKKKKAAGEDSSAIASASVSTARKASARKPAARKATASRRRRSTPKGSSARNSALEAAKKILDDIAFDEKLARTSKATQELAQRLYENAGGLVKDAASASSSGAVRARKATRTAAHAFVKSAIHFLEGIEHRMEAEPARKRPRKKAAAKKAGK